ncbi:nucleotidyltransferase domain-containing protein [Sporosarcina obsidiansis]|uniref:nucleotidyltransferase domain-containing protein n=1 Tax=Sporosarcina obsidiansis TaxID=2660748 RepID=UPI00129AF945|nr:nucleotidyltransferase domain-containing protein [Sporosarcina obsidiansis]
MNEMLINKLSNIAQDYPVIQSILLFGSRAHGDHTDLSDIDLAVQAPGLSKIEWLQLTDRMERELDTLLKLDLVLYTKASKPLQEQIDQCNKILYKKT